MTAEILNQLVIGIVSGLVASFMMLMIFEVYKKIIIPYVKGFLYDGIDINGKWEFENYFEYAKELVTLDLRHSETEITGSVVIHKEYSKQDKKKFEAKEVLLASAEGKIRDRFVEVRLQFTDRQRLGFVSFHVEVIADGSVMKGVSVWYDSGFSEIRSSSVVLKRYRKEPYYSADRYPTKKTNDGVDTNEGLTNSPLTTKEEL